MNFKYCKVRNVKSISIGTSGSAGYDLYVPKLVPVITTNLFGKEITTTYPEGYELRPLQKVKIPCGIKFKIPSGYALILANKSGIGYEHLLRITSPIIDSDFTGEPCLTLQNCSGGQSVLIMPEMKIVQFLLIPYIKPNPEEVDTVEELYRDFETERGENGFGHGTSTT